MLDLYNALIDIGFTQNQIDEMDIVYHLQLLAHRKQEKQENQKQNVVYWDQIFG